MSSGLGCEETVIGSSRVAMTLLSACVAAVLLALALCGQALGYVSGGAGRRMPSKMFGFMDAMTKALANDPSLPPAVNPGGKVAEPVVVEFLPSKKQIKAYPGQKLSMIASTAGERIKYSCKKGECATCEVNFNGKVVKACQASLPTVATAKKYTITIKQ